MSSAHGAHAVGDHLGLLHDLFHRELADDAAQVAFHDQADEAFALLRRLGQELLGAGEDRLLVALHLDLRDRLDGHGHALLRVEVLLRRDVERHQLEREGLEAVNHREDDRAAALDDARAADAVDDERLVRADFAVHLGDESEEHQRAGDDAPDDKPG